MNDTNKMFTSSCHKLYFRYGTMNSSKTMQLLVTAHNYERHGKRVIIVKPKIDTRFSIECVKSRTGLIMKADILVGINDSITDNDIFTCKKVGFSCVLVDECQFLTPKQIEELRLLTIHMPVICYGLRTNYTGTLFPGAKRLMELADSIEEIKNICTYCNRKSIINMKCIKGMVIKSGDCAPDLGCEEKYLPVCWKCWHYKEEYKPQQDSEDRKKR